jgi:hypothetical protein
MIAAMYYPGLTLEPAWLVMRYMAYVGKIRKAYKILFGKPKK